MSLEQLSKTVDFVQDATPSDANDGETYLDTSQSPPQLKVFDSGANAFVKPRSIQNLDAPVSDAGATQSDIETAVDNSTTASTVSNNLDAPVSTAGADLRFVGGFQMTLASFLQSFDTSAQAPGPAGVAFSPDGTSMFVVDDEPERVHQYSLTTGFDVGTASFTGNSINVRDQDFGPSDVAFNADGTLMFVLGNNSNKLFEYSLTTGFDVGTASFTGTNFSVTNEETNPASFTFSPDGTVMFVIGTGSGSVHQYSLTTGFDVGTASFTGTDFDATGQDTSPFGVTLSPDGTSMFIVGLAEDSLFQYSLSTAFDLSSASFTGNSFSVSRDNQPADVTFNADGTAMFLAARGSASVFQYNVGDLAPK